MTETVADLFWSQLGPRRERAALLVRRHGTFQAVTWGELAEDVRRLAVALQQLGVRPGERVAHLAENRYEWIVADLALHSGGFIHVPFHVSLSREQIARQIEHCAARLILVSSHELATKLPGSGVAGGQELPVLVYDADARTACAGTCYWLPELLDAVGAASLQPVAQAPDTPATILYTSGTTGAPKGVVLSQRNLVSNARAMLTALPQTAADVRLLFLPLSHIFARTCDLYTWLGAGTLLALATNRDTAIADSAEVRPTVISGVPLFYDRVYRLCLAANRGHLRSVREILGDRLRLCCCGGAPLPASLYDFYAAQGLPILEGYGLTEASPVISASTPRAHRRGSVGPPLANVEIRIAADGEILTRGPHVMLGYDGDSLATADVLRDGWLHTGDLGRLDDEGFLYLVGRKKEILVTLGGKNVAPAVLESRLTEDPLIHQALVVGDGRKYLAALLVPDFEALPSELEHCGIEVLDRDTAVKDARVRAIFAARIRTRLSSLADHEQVTRFTLLRRPFSLEAEELTPKLSLRRAVIAARFAAEIAAMYDEPDEAPAPPRYSGAAVPSSDS